MKFDVVATVPPHVVARRVDEEIVILDLEGGNYFGLDPIGARAWELIGEGLSLARVCDQMLQEFEVNRATLEHDISDLVTALRAANLLTFSD